MGYRKTLYLHIRSTNTPHNEIGCSVYADPILSNDNLHIFQIFNSKAADSSGIYVTNLGTRFWHVAIDNNGIPYIFDKENSKIIGGPLGNMECYMNNIPYNTWRRKNA
ncbi:hypothetical protein [Klebsiella sp. JB_Kp036]|uniref:hypothetical protein n=1 Tax=Klebsiella sp. JB_Kp036 TaxID=3153388 RepID=UPI0032B32D8E